jgi:hypothetical protein
MEHHEKNVIIKLETREMVTINALSNIEITNFKFGSPILNFLKSKFNKNINSYIFHKEVNFLGEPNLILILQEEIVITKNLEDEKNNSNDLSPKVIDYKTVLILLII